MIRSLDLPGGTNVSRETLERLEAFAALVEKWTPKINLIAKSTIDDIWDRHIRDSAQIFQLAPQNFDHWADFGSGGGFPAIVVAALSLETKPDAQFTLIESDQRKSVFLRTAIRELGLNATVHAKRIDAVPNLSADVISARALAPLAQLVEFSHPHLREGGVCLFPKGQSADDEIRDAERYWRFEIIKTPSITEKTAQILSINGLKRA